MKFDDDVIKFILQYIWVRNMKVTWNIRYIIFDMIFYFSSNVMTVSAFEGLI